MAFDSFEHAIGLASEFLIVQWRRTGGVAIIELERVVSSKTIERYL